MIPRSNLDLGSFSICEWFKQVNSVYLYYTSYKLDSKFSIYNNRNFSLSLFFKEKKV